MATHSSILAWRIPGTGEPGGLPSMRSHRVAHDWSDLAAAAAAAAWLIHVDVRQKLSQYCTISWVPLPVLEAAMSLRFARGIISHHKPCVLFPPPTAFDLLRRLILSSVPAFVFRKNGPCISIILWHPNAVCDLSFLVQTFGGLKKGQELCRGKNSIWQDPNGIPYPACQLSPWRFCPRLRGSVHKTLQHKQRQWKDENGGQRVFPQSPFSTF